MANINVSYEEMRNQARLLRDAQQRIEGDLRTLKGQIDSLVRDGFVTDRASVKFASDYEDYNKAAAETVAALDSIARNLEQTAQILEETDAQLAQ